VRVVFFGTPGFAATSLAALIESTHEVVAVVAQPDRKAGRGMKVQRPDTVLLSESEGLPVVQPSRIRDEAFLDTVRSLNPDAGVVVAYGRILPLTLLEIPACGFLNVHASILPAYRGAAPIQRAIENGERETGVSIMQVDEDLDHGPVFEIVRTEIGPDERAPELFERLAQIGATALVRVLDALEAGTARSTDQNHDDATLAPKIDKSEGTVNWNMSAESIFNRFRAFHPWPGVSVTLGGELVRLVEIRPAGHRSEEAGTLVAFDDDAIIVSAAGGSLRLLRVQRPGKGAVTGAELARGLRLIRGSRLL
jgi:methionyl-tRNA formyltransferase